MTGSRLRWYQKLCVAAVLVLSLFLITGHTITYAANESQSGNESAAKADDKSKKEDSSKDDKKESKDKDKKGDDEDKKGDDESSDEESDSEGGDDESESKDKDAPDKSYAAYVFDESDKNQAMMYYKSDVPKGAPSVETVVNAAAAGRLDGNFINTAKDIWDSFKKDGGNKFNQEGQVGGEYASFLKTLHDWNLYNTYTDWLQVGRGGFVSISALSYGGVMVALVWVGQALDMMIVSFAKIIQYLNIFQYLAPGGKIPKSNWLHGLQPLVDLLQKMGAFAMIFLALGFALLMLLTVIGAGKASNRGGYFTKGFIRKMVQALAIVALPLMLGAFLTSFSAAIIKGQGGDGDTKYQSVYSSDRKSGEDKGLVMSSIQDVPKQYVVDTEGWVAQSIKDTVSSKDETMNNGFVLKARGLDFPKTKEEVKNKIPDKAFVEGINKYAGDKDGVALLNAWRKSEQFTPGDLDSMYQISKKDKPHWWSDDDEKRLFQFKLAPESNKVKAFSGKDGAISLNLNEVAIKSANVAGNTSLGVALNVIEMGLRLFCLVFVSIAMLAAVFVGVFKSISLLGANLVKAQFGSMQGFLAVLSTCIMLVVTVVTAFLMISLYATLTGSLSNSIVDSLNGSFFEKKPGMVKQIIQTSVVSIVQIAGVFIVFKMRGAIIQAVQEFISSIMSRTGLMTAGQGRRPDGAEALRAAGAMAEANDDGQNLATGIPRGFAGSMKDGAKEGLSAAVAAAKDKDGDRSARSILGKTAKGAAAGLGGSASSRLKEHADNKAGKEGNISGKIAGAISTGMDAVADKMESGRAGKAMEDQEESLENLNDAQDKSAAAEDKYNDLQNKRDEAAAHGASADELEEMDEKIKDAGDELTAARQEEAEMAQNAVKSGAANEMAEESAEATAKDMDDADHAVQQAQRKLDELKDDREQAVANGASEEELAEIDGKIAKAEQELETAKDKQGMVESRYNDGNTDVVDRNAMNDAENDVLASKQAVRDAEEAYTSAVSTGGLNESEVQSMNQTASAFKKELDNAETQAQSAYDTENEKLSAMKRVDAHGAAFSDGDHKAQEGVVASASKAVASAQNEVDTLKANGASKSEIAQAQSKLNTAQASLEGAKEVQNAMQSPNGTVSAAAMEAQQQHVQKMETNQQAAQQKLNNLKAQQAAGHSIESGAIKNAQREVQQANAALKGANSVQSGLNAQRVTGGTVTKEALMQQTTRVKQMGDNLNKLKSHSADMAEASSQKQMSSKTINKIARAGTALQQQGSARAEAAQNVVNTQQRKLDNLTRRYNQPGGGGVSMRQIQRQQSAVKQAKQDYKSIVTQNDNMKSQMTQVRSTGQQMKQNVATANANRQSANTMLGRRQERYNHLQQTGGLSAESMPSLQQDVAQNRAGFEEDRAKGTNSFRQFYQRRHNLTQENRRNRRVVGSHRRDWMNKN